MASDDKHADASSAASATEPIASRLPAETWIQILSSLDYRRLQRIRRVSKRFKRLVEDQKFDRKLFRRRPVGGELKPGKKVAIHPLLSSVDCVFLAVNCATVLRGCYRDQSVSRYDLYDLPASPSVSSEDDSDDDNKNGSSLAKLPPVSNEAKPESPQEASAGKVDDDDDDVREFNGLEYPASDEFATSPACKELKIRMMGEYGFSKNDDIVVKDATGIKCDRVLVAIAKYWAKAAPAGAARQARAEWGWPKERKVCRNEVLGDHSFFEGWEEAVVKQNGSVYLEALGFGS
ncbi:hypothetical protein JCM8208_007373 [Rhodotorula glutinis]